MARPKKDGLRVNIYMERSLNEKLERFCEDTGMSKTGAVERALTQFIDEFRKRYNMPEKK